MLYKFFERVKPDETYNYTLNEYYVGEPSDNYKEERKRGELSEEFPPVHFNIILQEFLHTLL